MAYGSSLCNFPPKVSSPKREAAPKVGFNLANNPVIKGYNVYLFYDT